MKTIVKYIGQDTDDGLDRGVHLMVLAHDGEVMTCQDEDGHQWQIGARFTKLVDWECICPCCYLNRGRTEPHPFAARVWPEVAEREPDETPRRVNRIASKPFVSVVPSGRRVQTSLFE